MPKRQTTLRLSALSDRQLKALAARWGMSDNEVVMTCVDRIHREEMNQMDTEPRTYRVTARPDVDIFIPSDDPARDTAVLDMATVATRATEVVYEYRIEDTYTTWFERLLDASPAVIRWEAVTGNWPTPVR